MMNYTALGFIVSRPFTDANLKIIQALLDNGAYANMRLLDPDFDINNQENSPRKRPTLLHAVLARQPNGENEEQVVIRKNILINCRNPKRASFWHRK